MSTTITIDEKACVGCSLCVDICPTDVFAFDEEKALPEIRRVGECFGCLSCSEICPSWAIDHDGIELSENHYHDPYALSLASRMANKLHEMNVPETAERRAKALEDLGVRLLSMSSVLKQTLANSLPAVGTMAGRTLAAQLPRYRIPETLSDVLDLAREQFSPAWELEPRLEGDDKIVIEVKECYVRDLCRKEGIELGGEMCVLFYNYLAGYINRMGKVKPRLTGAERGDRCVYNITLFSRGT